MTTTPRILRDGQGRPIVPLDPGAEPFRQLVEARRKTLTEYNPSAVNFAANILKARSDRANGKTPSIRCEETDVEARLRRYQLAGQKPYRVEDGTAVFLENDLGQDVELDAAKTFLRIAATIAPEKVRALVNEVQALLGEPAPAQDDHDALAELQRAAGDLGADVSGDLKDGHRDEDHRAKVMRLVHAALAFATPAEPRFYRPERCRTEAHERARTSDGGPQ